MVGFDHASSICLGVLADTHIPDRVKVLDPRVIEIFRENRVQRILHAGDISTPQTLNELSKIGPVDAVRGNRDIWRLRSLPSHLSFEYNGIRLGISHGFGSFPGYWAEKIHLARHGYRFDFYQSRLENLFPGFDVIVFGHSHIPENRTIRGTLFFNPGSVCCPHRDTPASVGILRIQNSSVVGEIVPL